MKLQYVKIVVFVPKTHADLVRQAMGDAGAGKIGLYSYCSYSIVGTGRFKPLEGAYPSIGKVGKFAEAEEDRIESICERSKARGVIRAIKKVHPYESPAFDIYPLLSEGEV